MKNKIKKIIWVAAFVLCVWVSLKFIETSLADNIVCSSDASIKNWICVCKDARKIYQGWACAIDPTNLCPPDSKQVGANCICNDKNTIYDGVMCVTKPDLQCAYDGWIYKNGRCDFSQALMQSAPTPVETVAPVVPTLTKTVKILDLNTLAPVTEKTPVETQAKPEVSSEIKTEVKTEVKTNTDTKTDADTKISNQVWVNINQNVDQLWVYIK